MLRPSTISKAPPKDLGLDRERLQAEGMRYVQQYAGRRWTDHNLHDPGITILELLCYALTELGYKASLPVEDLLAAASGGGLADQFFGVGEILPCVPLTTRDYRKLLVDIPDVKNAWFDAFRPPLFLNTTDERLHATRPVGDGVREVSVRGLYSVAVEFEDGVEAAAAAVALGRVSARLRAHRNLCEDFLLPAEVAKDAFVLCCELQLAPEADATTTHAAVLFAVEQHLSPPVRRYDLASMLARTRADGGRYTVADLFEGPLLVHGFIDDDELDAAGRRTEVRLSDVISVIMDVDGVLAVRSIEVNPKAARAGGDRWRMPVAAGCRPSLEALSTRVEGEPRADPGSRIVSYKRSMPVAVKPAEVNARLDALRREARARDVLVSEPAHPTGRARDIATYTSVQSQLPAVYGLGDQGLPLGADEERKAKALQLRAYLLFFDQVMADDCAQLSHVRDLFRVRNFPVEEREFRETLFRQRVAFADAEKVYRGVDPLAGLDSDDAQVARRDRFLDHLLARFGEDFNELVAIVRDGATRPALAKLKSEFLRECPSLGAERGQGEDRTPGADPSRRPTSGLVRRLERLLGIPAAPPAVGQAERILLVENMLLRLKPDGFGEPWLPVCVDPHCEGCPDDDPYSYRVHFVLPAGAGRFVDMNFRRFAEEVIRQETPAHILPKVCWASEADVRAVASALDLWRVRSAAASTASEADRAAALKALIEVLYRVRSVFPEGALVPCDDPTDRDRFILTQTRLGSTATSPPRPPRGGGNG